MRVCCTDGRVLTKVFGSGIAFPTLTNDGMVRTDLGTKGHRADSFSLYSNWVANKILASTIPKNQLNLK